jgi:methylmalonyl-CoA mutase C-terminal domain/subunit
LTSKKASPRKILVAKSSLDGHWRGVMVVARAFRDAGFEVVLGGMMTAGDIARVAADEDVDLVGLNVGGRVEVVFRILDTLKEAGLGDVPVLVGGTVPPQSIGPLTERGVGVFPPGSSLQDIVAHAREVSDRSGSQA